MSVRNTLDRELRHGGRLPAHVRRREARRLAAALAAAGYGRPSFELPGDSQATRAAFQGASIAVAVLNTGREIGRAIDSLFGRRA
ncbi:MULTISPECIES: hypothetical protein [Methylobacteriaceae]|uniref:hypothetical protein n=1 Tax=Methylobacteriaceae TaxID=119045 RepID=UPI000CDA593B|nr:MULTISPECIES: hypothetical protein [Methylobacteriaceae]MCP1549452.1 hypothetical protein [Methylorubrum zatmanii]MCP1553935.1 hypothetical protein [Methylorubrum extorquens]MCP1579754.1 hypothetical protein [Methylorubrum extorquens]POR40992.1 hypothetical protein CRT23_21105 [Methylobacterium sp. V23]